MKIKYYGQHGKVPAYEFHVAPNTVIEFSIYVSRKEGRLYFDLDIIKDVRRLLFEIIGGNDIYSGTYSFPNEDRFDFVRWDAIRNILRACEEYPFAPLRVEYEIRIDGGGYATTDELDYMQQTLQTTQTGDSYAEYEHKESK